VLAMARGLEETAPDQLKTYHPARNQAGSSSTLKRSFWMNPGRRKPRQIPWNALASPTAGLLDHPVRSVCRFVRVEGMDAQGRLVRLARFARFSPHESLRHLLPACNWHQLVPNFEHQVSDGGIIEEKLRWPRRPGSQTASSR
jgi:hypothetical protein